ncbi:MAG: sugar phosphate nucleotidyltransferase [Campylobacterota bacterium]|nr:sugar phosphate nucleotidyltransferase [Campylobacterota bacterium]
MKAVVMAGGFGTRIQPLTNSRPKPMLPIVNKPMMEHTMMTLKDLGITEFIILLYFKPEIIKDHFRDGSDFGIKITYVVPDDDYGTAGAVKLAQEHIGDENFIIISGDLVTDFDFQQIFDYHQQKESKLTITLTSVDNPLQFGVVIANEEGKIEKFLEKPSWGEVFSDTINTGIYIIEPEILDYIPQGSNFDFAKDLFPLLMKEDIDLMAGYAQGYWRDVGNPESYREVYDDILTSKVKFTYDGIKTEFPDGLLYSAEPVELDSSIEIIGTVVLGKNVTLGKRAKLNNVVIGDNVAIGASCKIRNTVFWNDVEVGKSVTLDGCVICNNNVFGKNSQAKAGMILAEGCEIGQLVSIEQDITIWPDKKIDDAAIVSNNVVWGSKYKNSIFENGSVIGKSNVELSCEMSTKLAEAFGAQLPVGSTVYVSRDAHKSSRMLKRAFLGGLLASGIHVMDLKSMPSAVLRYNLSKNPDIIAGIHFRENVIDPTSTELTFFNEEGLRIDTGTAQSVEKAFFKETFRRVDYKQIGVIHETEHHNLHECLTYKNALESTVDQAALKCSTRCRVAVDVMHGGTAEIFPEVMHDLNIDNIILNAHHGSHRLSNFLAKKKKSEEDLTAIVKNLEMDMGFMIYPNGQRLNVVTDEGVVLGQETALLVILYLLNLEAGEGAMSVFLPSWAPDVMDDTFENLTIERGKYANFKAAELKKYDLIATLDGNFAFTEFALHRDSMYACLKMIALTMKHNIKLSDIVRKINSFHYSTHQIPCTQALKGKMMRKFLEEAKGKRSSSADGVKIWVYENDWVLMIPDQYSDSLNLFIQAKDVLTGNAIYDIYKAKIEEWSKE